MNAKTIAVVAGIAVLAVVAALLLQPGQAPAVTPVTPPAGGDLSSDLSSLDALLNTTELPAEPDVNASVAEPF